MNRNKLTLACNNKEFRISFRHAVALCSSCKLEQAFFGFWEGVLSRAYLIEGPVAAGKSTFSEGLSQKIGAPHFNLDAWMTKLFRPDRPATGTMAWYIERKERCIEQIWDIALRVLNSKCDVILELGLIQRESRRAMYERIEESGHKFLVYVLDAPREERRERV